MKATLLIQCLFACLIAETALLMAGNTHPVIDTYAMVLAFMSRWLIRGDDE